MKKIILTLIFLLFILLFACSSDNTNEKVNTENINLKSQIQNLDIKNNELNQKIESIKIQKDNLDIKNNELNQKIESLNKEIESLNKESESKIKETNDLKNQLDEIINGAERTFANLQIAYDKNDYNLVKELYGNMEKNHFTSSLYPEAKIIYEKIIKQEQLKVAEAKAKIAEEKAKTEKIKQEQLKALNKLVKKHDDVQGIDFYHSDYVYPHYRNGNKISLYIASKSNTNVLRIYISYKGDSWLFFEKVYLSYDGYTLEIKFEEYEDKHTDVLTGGNGVAEWIDVRVLSSYSLEYLRRFANSPNAKMRLAGKSFSKDRILGKFEKLGIIEVLDGLQALEKY